MRKHNKHETIYVVSSTDILNDGTTDHLVTGAYRTRGKALDACTEYILERMHCRNDIADAFAHDVNHDEMAGSIGADENEETVFIKPEPEIRAYVRDTLGGDGCYYIESDLHDEGFFFDIDEVCIED